MTQTGEIGEAVGKSEIVEIANVHAVFVHVAEKMVGCLRRLGEYPTTLTQTQTLLRVARDQAK